MTKSNIVKFQFEQWGMKVDRFTTGEEALAAFKTNKYDLAVLDYTMPKKEGIEVAKNIRVEEKLKDLPLILYTTSQGVAKTNNQYKKLFNAILERPIRYPMLHKAMIDVLKSRK